MTEQTTHVLVANRIWKPNMFYGKKSCMEDNYMRESSNYEGLTYEKHRYTCINKYS